MADIFLLRAVEGWMCSTIHSTACVIVRVVELDCMWVMLSVVSKVAFFSRKQYGEGLGKYLLQGF